ncbi:Leucine-rich repeat receptor-like protein kinase family protein [Melia azedarach]|uniref:Leucine-rich repeat receptor-like protein kinase family protein n=1 Tax=Melia azedarach TaxID=155640 RepID=A0ACC1X5B5_MELAZ|nr:Leucine-rich repeat receptor-like protein kinase family protein [Melia azedarach]
MATACPFSFLFSLVCLTLFTFCSASTEVDILLSFKASIDDSKNSLSSWSNASSIHYCNWTGITCATTPSLTVTSINLQSFNLTGEISSSVCELSNLTSLNLADNLFNQPIPLHLSQCSSLETLNLSNNLIWGKIPEGIGSLVNLQVLNLGSNLLSGSLPLVFGNFSELVVLDLSQNAFLDLSLNNLTGEVPQSLGSSLTKLVSFDVSQNKLAGSFPNGICNAKGLANLSLHKNFFNGSISNSINECLNLERFQVQNNGFSGDFPDKLWSLPKIKLIRAENNRFSGNIPDSISMAAQLEQVQIDNNNFVSTIPHGLGLVKSLYRFSASQNSFYGSLPPNFCDSPPELPVLTYLDLSDNNLTGPIPQGLQNLKLALFNVSFNKLSGRVPYSLISGLPASFLQGNPGLCGPGLPNSCDESQPKHHTASLTALTCAMISIAFAIATMMVAAGFFIFHQHSKRKSQAGVWRSVFFYPLRVTEHDLVIGMDEKSAVGIGGPFGRVYILSLPSKISSCSGVSDLKLPLALPRDWRISTRIMFRICFTETSSQKIFSWMLILSQSSQILLLIELWERLHFTQPWLQNRHHPVTMHPNMDTVKRQPEQMDVYGFGVVLLELITGRQAEEAEPAESLDIVKWVRRKINITNGAFQVLDPKISNSSQQEMLGALEIALRCTSVMPEKRPSMFEVVRALQSLSPRTSLPNMELSSTSEEHSIPL